jgi:hypothetical protein
LEKIHRFHVTVEYFDELEGDNHGVHVIIHCSLI